MMGWPVPVAAVSKGGIAAARLLGMRFLIPPAACMSFSCERCVLTGRGLSDGPIFLLEESYRVWYVRM